MILEPLVDGKNIAKNSDEARENESIQGSTDDLYIKKDCLKNKLGIQVDTSESHSLESNCNGKCLANDKSLMSQSKGTIVDHQTENLKRQASSRITNFLDCVKNNGSNCQSTDPIPNHEVNQMIIAGTNLWNPRRG